MRVPSRIAACFLLSSLAVLLASLAAPACAGSAGSEGSGDTPIVLLRFDLSLATARPGQSVTASVEAVVNSGGTLGGTLDLAALGLSAAYPLTGTGQILSATFTVPAGTPPGMKTITANLTDGQGNTLRPFRALTVTLAPILTALVFSPSTVAPGGATTLCATVSPGAAPITSVYADLSPLGLSPFVPLVRDGSGDTYCASITIPADAKLQDVPVNVYATDATGDSARGTATLKVYRPVPPTILDLSLSTRNAHAGQAVTLTLSLQESTCLTSGVSADLSALGLSANVPLTGTGGTRILSFTVPASATPGDYPVIVTVTDACGGVQKRTATLTVTLAPVVSAPSLSPTPAMPGRPITLEAGVLPGRDPVAVVSADLTSLGLSPLSLSKTGSNAPWDLYAGTFTVPSSLASGTYPIPVIAMDTAGRSTTNTVNLVISYADYLGALSFVARPDRVLPGQGVTLTLSFELTGCIPQTATADLSAFGLSAETPLTGVLDTRAVMLTVPKSAAPGPYTVTATLMDTCGEVRHRKASFTVLPILPGDVNLDSAVTLEDVAATLRAAAGLTTPGPLSVTAAGHAPTIADAISLLRKIR